MPTLVRRDEDRLAKLRALQESADYFQRHLDDLRARGVSYVVLHEDDVVGEGDSPEEAWGAAEQADAPIDECVMVYVPDEGETFYL